MFILDQDFDLGMIYFIRNSTKNFIESNRDISINGLPLSLASEVEENEDAKNLDDYIKNISNQSHNNLFFFSSISAPISFLRSIKFNPDYYIKSSPIFSYP